MCSCCYWLKYLRVTSQLQRINDAKSAIKQFRVCSHLFSKYNSPSKYKIERYLCPNLSERQMRSVRVNSTPWDANAALKGKRRISCINILIAAVCNRYQAVSTESRQSEVQTGWIFQELQENGHRLMCIKPLQSEAAQSLWRFSSWPRGKTDWFIHFLQRSDSQPRVFTFIFDQTVSGIWNILDFILIGLSVGKKKKKVSVLFKSPEISLTFKLNIHAEHFEDDCQRLPA